MHRAYDLCICNIILNLAWCLDMQFIMPLFINQCIFERFVNAGEYMAINTISGLFYKIVGGQPNKC